MSVQTELPEDYWHTYIYVNFGWLCCSECEIEPSLDWAWEGIAPGEQGVVQFTIRAVKALQDEGWIMHNDYPCCPKCVAEKAT